MLAEDERPLSHGLPPCDPVPKALEKGSPAWSEVRVGRAWGVLGDLPKLTMPTVFALGVRDPIVRPDQTLALQRIKPDLEVRRIMGLTADHVLITSTRAVRRRNPPRRDRRPQHRPTHRQRHSRGAAARAARSLADLEGGRRGPRRGPRGGGPRHPWGSATPRPRWPAATPWTTMRPRCWPPPGRCSVTGPSRSPATVSAPPSRSHSPRQTRAR